MLTSQNALSTCQQGMTDQSSLLDSSNIYKRRDVSALFPSLFPSSKQQQLGALTKPTPRKEQTLSNFRKLSGTRNNSHAQAARNTKKTKHHNASSQISMSTAIFQRIFSIVPGTASRSPTAPSSLPLHSAHHQRPSSGSLHTPNETGYSVMSGNYPYNTYNTYNRPPPNSSQSRQQQQQPQTPQYQHGHQSWAPHAYQNIPPAQYMAPFPQYPNQPYQPSFPNDRHIDYPPGSQASFSGSQASFSGYPPGQQPPPPNQPPPRPAPSPPDQYGPDTAAPSRFWDDRNQPQNRGFDEREEQNAAMRAFRRFDQDGGGYLDLQEFMDALRALHLAISYHEALDCFVRCDVNEDGRITQDEFVRIYVDEKKNRPQPMHYQQPPPPPGNPPHQSPQMRP